MLLMDHFFVVLEPGVVAVRLEALRGPPLGSLGLLRVGATIPAFCQPHTKFQHCSFFFFFFFLNSK
jgi:hypothetical protein